MSARKIREDELWECKQCFRVVLANNFRRHLSSREHNAKACILALGKQILRKCPKCKDTKNANIRAQCIKCCETLEKMYDNILKPLEASNDIAQGSSSVHETLNVLKLDPKLLDGVHKVSSKSSKRSTSNKNTQNNPKPSNKHVYKIPHKSGSKHSQQSSKTFHVNQTQKTSDSCSYKRSYNNSAIQQRSLNAWSSSSLDSSKESYKEEPIEMSTQVFPLPDKPSLTNEYYDTQPSDKASKERHKTTQSNGLLTVSTGPSNVQKQSECTTISVQVVEKHPDVSEYIFKFWKRSTPDNPKLREPRACHVQPVNISKRAPQLKKIPRQSSGSFRSLTQDMIDRFPDIEGDAPAGPLLPMTADDPVTTSNGSAGITVYDDWYLATDMGLSDSENSTDQLSDRENNGINKPRIRCRDLSSLMP